MTPFHAIVLGMVQGATEFLPVSSSGHLILVPRLLGWPDQGLAFDAAVHLGTVSPSSSTSPEPLRRMAAGILTGRPADHRLAAAVVLGSSRPGSRASPSRRVIESQLRSVTVVAASTILWALVLWWADRRAAGTASGTFARWASDGRSSSARAARRPRPGTSRSGVTLCAGLFSGLARPTAPHFAFLLGLPITMAAGLLEATTLVRRDRPGTSSACSRSASPPRSSRDSRRSGPGGCLQRRAPRVRRLPDRAGGAPPGSRAAQRHRAGRPVGPAASAATRRGRLAREAGSPALRALQVVAVGVLMGSRLLLDREHRRVAAAPGARPRCPLGRRRGRRRRRRTDDAGERRPEAQEFRERRREIAADAGAARPRRIRRDGSGSSPARTPAQPRESSRGPDRGPRRCPGGARAPASLTRPCPSRIPEPRPWRSGSRCPRAEEGEDLRVLHGRVLDLHDHGDTCPLRRRSPRRRAPGRAGRRPRSRFAPSRQHHVPVLAGHARGQVRVRWWMVQCSPFPRWLQADGRDVGTPAPASRLAPSRTAEPREVRRARAAGVAERRHPGRGTTGSVSMPDRDPRMNACA